MGTSRGAGFWVATISLFLESAEAQLFTLGYATDTLIFKLFFNMVL